MPKPSQKELNRRVNAQKGALAAQFDAIGRLALLNVLTGRVGHSKAMKCLGKLRELTLDRDGDMASKPKVKLWLSRNGMLKGTNLEWLHD